MPYYRITIWVKNNRKPLQGIRQLEQYNIDVVNNMVKKMAQSHITGSNIIDIEVAMLSKNSSAVIKYLNNPKRK